MKTEICKALILPVVCMGAKLGILYIYLFAGIKREERTEGNRE
jgi:hypothetical protein